ncbi:MAG: LPXTG cell wall anchor domain-containing protein [Actinomycetota bacterium]
MKVFAEPFLGRITLGVVAAVATLGIGAAMAPTASAQAAGTADGSAYVLHDLQCDPKHDGVLDITLVNDDAAASAVFTVATDAHPSQVTVGPRSASALTMTRLADGPVVVPVMVNGVSSDVAVTVSCDPAQVEVLPPTIAPTTTAVASSPAHPSTIISAPASDGATLPSTGSSTRGLVIGGVLVVAGIAASLLARRRYS